MRIICKTIIFTSLAIIVLSSSKCNKRIDCSQNIYQFNGLEITVQPNLDSLPKGDTVWFESEIPTTLLDNNSNKEVNYSGAQNLGMAFVFYELVMNAEVKNAGAAFDYFVSKGSYVGSVDGEDRTRSFLYVEENGKYLLKVGIIPKRAGIFAIGTGNAANVATVKNECNKANFEILLTETDQNLHYYENSRPGYNLSEYERTHLYCFKAY